MAYKKPTTSHPQYGLPYLIVVEIFNSNTSEPAINEAGQNITTPRRRDYWKKTWITNDSKGNNTFLLEMSRYAYEDYTGRMKEITPEKDSTYFSLYPNKAYITFLVDRESVISNNGYMIEIVEENLRKEKVSYSVLVNDDKLIKFRNIMHKGLEDFNTNL